MGVKVVLTMYIQCGPFVTLLDHVNGQEETDVDSLEPEKMMSILKIPLAC